MKTSKKHCLQVSEHGRMVHVFRDGHRIIASVWDGSKHTAFHEFTFQQFANLLERLRDGIAETCDNP